MADRIGVWIQWSADRPFPRLQWYDADGNRRSRATKTTDEKQLERLRADLEYELNHGAYREKSRVEWSTFRKLFEEEHVAGLRAKTQEKYGAVLDVFEQLARPKRLAAITERTLSQFAAALRAKRQPNGKVGLAAWSQKNYLMALKKALKWAVEQKLMPALPAFPAIKVPKKKPQPVSQEAFEQLLTAAPDDRWRAYFLCGWWSGLRLSEARQLRRLPAPDAPWVDWNANRIVLPASFVKADEDQWLPLHATLREALEALPDDGPELFPFAKQNGEPLLGNSITSRIRRFAERAGVKLTMHQLRKGFGCRVAKQLGKGQAPILHRLMRHSSMQVTMEFYASVDDALQDAIDELK